MSYRNDHDAALLRVDALEADNARLAAENAKLRAGETVELPKPKRSTKRGLMAATFVGVAFAMAAGVIAIAEPDASRRLPAPTPPVADDKPAALFTKADIDECTLDLVRTPAYHDAVSTDPHGAARSVGPALQASGCLAEIRGVLDYATISPEERTKLEIWADAQTRLDATVAMVAEYYKGDPYKLDGYSTAPQLWTEYNRALEVRNTAYEEWRGASR